MKKDESQRLEKAYLEGETSLLDEAAFFVNKNEGSQHINIWKSFVNNQRIEVPSEWEESMWDSFGMKKRKKRKRILIPFSVVTILMIFISVFYLFPRKEMQSEAQKERLLEEAKAMFHSDEQVIKQYSVFYENELIVLYMPVE